MCPLCPLPSQNSVRARFFENLRKSKKKLDKGITCFEALEREIRGPRTIKGDKQTEEQIATSRARDPVAAAADSRRAFGSVGARLLTTP